MVRFVCGVGLAVACVGGLCRADDKDPLKLLEGSYDVTALVKGGKPMPKEFVDGLKVKIADGELTLTVKGEDKRAKLKADAEKSPATIDVSPADGQEKGKTFPGIYKLDGTVLTIAFSETTDRPKDFKGEGENTVLTLKKAAK